MFSSEKGSCLNGPAILFKLDSLFIFLSTSSGFCCCCCCCTLRVPHYLSLLPVMPVCRFPRCLMSFSLELINLIICFLCADSQGTTLSVASAGLACRSLYRVPHELLPGAASMIVCSLAEYITLHRFSRVGMPTFAGYLTSFYLKLTT